MLPHRVVSGYWQRLLHDRTSDRIAAYVGELPNVNTTIVPFQLGKRRRQLVPWKAGGSKDRVRCTTPNSARAPSRAARRNGRKDGGRAGRRVPERLHLRFARAPFPSVTCARDNAPGLQGGSGQSACGREPVSHRSSARFPTGPARSWPCSKAGGVWPASSRGTGRGRRHGRQPRSQRRDGKSPLLGDLNPGSRRAFSARLTGQRVPLTVDGLFPEGRCPGLAPDRRHLSRRSEKAAGDSRELADQSTV